MASCDHRIKCLPVIINPLDKWLAFFTYKEPKDIISFVNKYPEFLPLYREITEFRKDPKEAISMYSEALSVLDHNTELYMIEEKQQEIEALQEKNQALTQELAQKNSTIAEYEARYGKL